ncbi:IL10 protein, partial [Nesospiza acunhae]|nr:IL10 protein [Nesospiza acunhae]
RGTAVPILLLPLLLLLLGSARAQPSCLRFPELLPAKLKELRLKFEEIKDYFQSKDDDLSIQLLSSNLLEEIKGSLGCQSVSEMMEFYLEEVLPRAMRSSSQHQHSMEPWGGTLGLRLCSGVPLQHKFFTCEERSRSMEHVKKTYSRMKRNGIYKAMGEFDIFINYIERYLTMRRRN